VEVHKGSGTLGVGSSEAGVRALREPVQHHYPTGTPPISFLTTTVAGESPFQTEMEVTPVRMLQNGQDNLFLICW
jgi:hypothetical protein